MNKISITTRLTGSYLATIHIGETRVGFAHRIGSDPWNAFFEVDGIFVDDYAAKLSDIVENANARYQIRLNRILGLGLSDGSQDTIDTNVNAVRKVREHLANIDTYRTPFPPKGQIDSRIARQRIAAEGASA